MIAPIEIVPSGDKWGQNALNAQYTGPLAPFLFVPLIVPGDKFCPLLPGTASIQAFYTILHLSP